jgi:hypothetical protein
MSVPVKAKVAVVVVVVAGTVVAGAVVVIIVVGGAVEGVVVVVAAAAVTTNEAIALRPDVSPVSVTVWPPVANPVGTVALKVTKPAELAAKVPSGRGVERRRAVIFSPGWKPMPVTVKLAPWAMLDGLTITPVHWA